MYFYTLVIHPCHGGKGAVIRRSQELAEIGQRLVNPGNYKNPIKRKLRLIQDNYDFFLIDTPPGYSKIGECGIEACQVILIPAECTGKGICSLNDTLKFLKSRKEAGILTGNILGIIPFREHYFGENMATDSKIAKDMFAEILQQFNLTLLPSIIESEAYGSGLILRELPGSINSCDELNFSIYKVAN